MPRQPIPPNTRIHRGYIEFRKLYKGSQLEKTWPDTPDNRKTAFDWIYSQLGKISRGERIGTESKGQISIEIAADTYLKLHGPSLKGGINGKNYKNLSWRLGVIKKAWAGRHLDTITKHDVRDLISQFKTIGNAMRYLNLVTHIFSSYETWNEEGNVLKFAVKLPAYNPARKWRKEMKAASKKELPRRRVLSLEEWGRFRTFLRPRTREICEIALRRFLRPCDIKRISKQSIKNEMIEGVQEKTGEMFSVPVMDGSPVRYDFTNFRREFHAAQVAAGMNFPDEHPLSFTVRDLRRTGATWAYRKTKDLVTISHMLGHTSIKTTIRYLNIEDTDKAKVARVIDDLFGEELGEKIEKFKKYVEESRLKIDQFKGA